MLFFARNKTDRDVSIQAEQEKAIEFYLILPISRFSKTMAEAGASPEVFILFSRDSMMALILLLFYCIT